jgi:hypothetical protein
MIVKELIAELREDILDDTRPEYLWSSSSLVRFLNEAVYEANVRSHLLHSKKTISIVAGQSEYKVDCSTDGVLEIRIDGKCPLVQMTTGDLTDSKGCCWTNTEGNPEAYVYEDGVITLYPKPLANASMAYSVSIIPSSLTVDSELPISRINAHALLYWCAYRAFLKPDLDTIFYQKASDYLAMFERHFGPAKSELKKRMERTLPKGATIMLGRMA